MATSRTPDDILRPEAIGTRGVRRGLHWCGRHPSVRRCEKIGPLLSRALPGWLSFRNFGMPGITGWATQRSSKQATLLPLGHPSLTAKGSACWQADTKVLQENHPYGPGVIFSTRPVSGCTLPGNCSPAGTNLPGSMLHSPRFIFLFTVNGSGLTPILGH